MRKIIYYKGKLILQSPLVVGGNQSKNSDNDLCRNGKGEIIIPGNSIAGVIRNFCNENFRTTSTTGLIKNLFGYLEQISDNNHESRRKSEEKSESNFIFYDAIYHGLRDIQIRDNVKLKPMHKIAMKHNKFNYETLLPNEDGFFDFRFCLDLSDEKENGNYNEDQIENLLNFIIFSLYKGKIRFGSKITRGFGKLQLSEIMKSSFNLNDMDQINFWIEFDWDEMKPINLEELNIMQESKKAFVKMIVDFKIPYSLLIKTYQFKLGLADSIQINNGIYDVIPGTSWTGLIRNGVQIVLSALNCDHDKIKKFSNELFGFSDKIKDETISKRSRIFIEESKIESNVNIEYTRNKIDRFTGGTIDGALLAESSSYGGHCKLELVINNPENEEVAVILLVMFDICNGLLPVGGTNNIGRGILQGTKIKILIDENEYIIDSFDGIPNDEYFNTIFQDLHAYIKNSEIKQEVKQYESIK